MIVMNGEIVAQGPQFDLNDVDVVTATVDIEDVRSRRTSISRNHQAAQTKAFHRVHLEKSLSRDIGEDFYNAQISKPFLPKYHVPEEEIAYVISSFFSIKKINVYEHLLVLVQLHGFGITYVDPGLKVTF